MLNFILSLFNKRKTAVRYIAIDGGVDTTLGGRTVTVCSHAYHNKAEAMEYLGVGETEIIKIRIQLPDRSQ